MEIETNRNQQTLINKAGSFLIVSSLAIVQIVTLGGLKKLTSDFLETHGVNISIIKSQLPHFDLPPPALAPIAVTSNNITHSYSISDFRKAEQGLVQKAAKQEEQQARIQIAREILFAPQIKGQQAGGHVQPDILRQTASTKSAAAPSKGNAHILENEAVREIAAQAAELDAPIKPSVLATIDKKVEKAVKDIDPSLQEGKLDNLYPAFQAVGALAKTSPKFKPSYDVPNWLITTSFVESRWLADKNAKGDPLRYNLDPLAHHISVYGDEIIEGMKALGDINIAGVDYFAQKTVEQKNGKTITLPSPFQRFCELVESLKRTDGNIENAFQRENVKWVCATPYFSGAVQIFLAMDKLPSFLETVQKQDPALAEIMFPGAYYAFHNAGIEGTDRLTSNLNRCVAGNINPTKLNVFGIRSNNTTGDALELITLRQIGIQKTLANQLAEKGFTPTEVAYNGTKQHHALGKMIANDLKDITASIFPELRQHTVYSASMDGPLPFEPSRPSLLSKTGMRFASLPSDTGTYSR